MRLQFTDQPLGPMSDKDYALNPQASRNTNKSGALKIDYLCLTITDLKVARTSTDNRKGKSNIKSGSCPEVVTLNL